MMKAKYTSPRNSTDSSLNPSLKQAEEAMKAKLPSLMDAMEYLITQQDTEYNVIYNNKQARIISGGDHVGEKCYRAFEGRERVCDGCPIEEAFKDGKSHVLEKQRVLPSGELSFWEITANPVRDAEGRVVSCLEIVKNITERKHSEEKHRIILETAPDGFYVVDMDARLLEVNDSYCKMVGYTRKELLKMSVPDIEVIETPEEIARHVRNVVEQGYSFFETQHQRKDGKIIDVEVSAHYIDVEGGQIVIFVRNTTDRKRAERALIESEGKYRTLVENIPQKIFFKDKDSVYISCNSNFAKDLKLKPAEISRHTAHEREIAAVRARELSRSHQRLINAQESLRKEIASQLHGTVQSRLILLEYKIAELEAKARSKWMTKELADIRQRLEELQNEHIRSISHRLFPSILRLGITTGLESLIDEYSAKLPVDLLVSKKLRDREQANRKLIPDNVKLALYRIAEEALTNISKHTPAANNIVMKLSLSDSRILRLKVRDNGPGSNTTSPSTGIGLSLISDYAAAAGGSCTIETIPGKGTRVTAELPFAGHEPKWRQVSL